MPALLSTDGVHSYVCFFFPSLFFPFFFLFFFADVLRLAISAAAQKAYGTTVCSLSRPPKRGCRME